MLTLYTIVSNTHPSDYLNKKSGFSLQKNDKFDEKWKIYGSFAIKRQIDDIVLIQPFNQKHKNKNKNKKRQ